MTDTPVFCATEVAALAPSKPAFLEGFGNYASAGDKITLEHDGITYTATLHNDDDSDAPWERDDSHGPVTDWMSKDDKRAGYRVLSVDGRSARFYDFAEAIEIAKRDGWDSEPYNTGTKGERAVRAVEADFKALKAWCNDEWHYVGVSVTAERLGVDLVDSYDVALWGIECNYPNADNSYLLEVANDLLPEAITQAQASLTELRAKL